MKLTQKNIVFPISSKDEYLHVFKNIYYHLYSNSYVNMKHANLKNCAIKRLTSVGNGKYNSYQCDTINKMRGTENGKCLRISEG